MEGDSPKVSSLEARRPRPVDVEDVLEVLVERVEQSVREPPEEEEDGDEADGVDGLAQRQLGGASRLVVRCDEAAPLGPVLEAHVGSAFEMRLYPAMRKGDEGVGRL